LFIVLPEEVKLIETDNPRRAFQFPCCRWFRFFWKTHIDMPIWHSCFLLREAALEIAALVFVLDFNFALNPMRPLCKEDRDR